MDWEYIKKLNDDIWVAYSGYGMPVLLVFLVYKILYPIFWQDIKQMHEFPKLQQDKILRPFLIYGPIYYFFDVVIKLLGNLAFKDACSGILLRLKQQKQASFFSHHLVCLIFLPLAVTSKYIPWFFIVFFSIISLNIALGHAILLWYKVKILEYLYLISLLVYHYGVNQPPWNQIKQFKLLNFGTWFLHLTIIALWLNGCSN